MAMIDNDIFYVTIITFLGLIRYIPQIYFDISGRNRAPALSWPSITKASYIAFLYLFILLGFFSNSRTLKNTNLFHLLGLIIFFIGNVLGMISLYSLKKNKSYDEGLVVYSNGVLICEGIYGIIRHPFRVGQLMEMTGLVMLSENVILLPLLGFVFIIQIIRTSDEEDMLLFYFGARELQYIKEVPKFNLIKGIYLQLKKLLTTKKHIQTIGGFYAKDGDTP